jgi:branched-subunit amino acid ABC-type transport system permease component
MTTGQMACYRTGQLINSQHWSGAVIAKIVVLVFIIMFIQKRPQGLFALKGRFVEN